MRCAIDGGLKSHGFWCDSRMIAIYATRGRAVPGFTLERDLRAAWWRLTVRVIDGSCTAEALKNC